MRAYRLAIALLAAAAAAEDGRRTVELVGYAFDRETGAPLYSERHVQEFRGEALVSHLTEYRTPAGRLFATKALDYGTHPFAPSYRLTDLRDGYVEGAEYVGDEFRMYRTQDGATKAVTIPASPDLVADSGFDRFVKARLHPLIDRRTQRMRLAIAGRLTTIALRLDSVAISSERHEIELIAKPDSLLRWFVAPIRLTYDTDSGRLVRYVGHSNIRSPSGELYDARIEFPAGGSGAGFDVGR